MKTAILFQSKYGFTKQIAQIIRETLPGETQIFNLRETLAPDIQNFQTVIIGSSIYLGTVQKNIKNWIDKNLPVLLSKKIGLFTCGMETGEKARRQINNAFPEALRNHAFKIQAFEGGFDFSKMNFFEKAIIRKIARIKESVSKINPAAVKEFAKGF